MGVVSQDPVLFGVSVRDNIALGVPGNETGLIQEALATPAAPGKTIAVDDAAIVAAAKAANAHDFITNLPQGYDTIAATSVAASQMSGGE